MSALDADALATLTPEEREAIEADDMTADDRAALAAVAGDAAPATDADSDDEDDDEDDDDEAAGDAAPVEGQGAAPAKTDATDEPPAKPKAEAVPRYQAELPADYDDKIKDLKARDAELRQKFKDGEIDIDERDAGLAEITEQREALLVQRAKAEISTEMTQQSAAEQWRATVAASIESFAKPENGGIDYTKDAEAMEALDSEVKALGQMPRHANKPMEWFMQEAHRRVLAERGITLAPKPAPQKDPVADARAARKPPVDAAPKTLAQVPGSDGPGDVGDEFADILALDGVEYEDAIGRLARTDPAKFDRFMRGR